MTTLILRISAYVGVAHKLERTFCIMSVMYVCACLCVSASDTLRGCVCVGVCVYVRRLIVVVVVIVAAGLLMKVCVIKSVHWGPRLRPASLKLHLIENGTAVMI